MEIANKIVKMNKRLIVGLVGIALGFSLAVSAQGANATVQDNVVVEDSDVVLQIGSAVSSDKAKSISKVQVIGNYRTVSKAKINKAKDRGRCNTISGQKAIQLGVMTQGYNGSGVGYAPENRTTTMCDTNNDGKFDVRAECGNKLRVTRQPRPAKAEATIWVNNFSKATAKISAKVKVKAIAFCNTENASASAFARATASSKAAVKVKTLTGADGKIKDAEMAKVKTQAVANAAAQAKAKAKAKVEASANCRSEVVTTAAPLTPDEPEVPDQPAPQPGKARVEQPAGKGAPEALPDTGPGAVVATFVGVSSLASLAYSTVMRRLG